MFHFVRTGGPIPSNHLSNLIAYFSKREIPYVIDNRLPSPERIIENDAYITCDLNLDTALKPARGHVFQVQLAHNLTGLKGSNLIESMSDLNILAGMQHIRSYRLDHSDERFVIGGYAKWDSIYEERFHMQQRRNEIANTLKCDADIPWVVFYPTGPNPAFRGNQHRTFDLFKRLTKNLGKTEFFFCNHAHTAVDKTTKKHVKKIERLSAKNPHIHIVDGEKSLPCIASCDLFITDIASTLITALSMNKPVAFISIEHKFPNPARLKEFQCGTFIDEITDFREYIDTYSTSEPLMRLFRRCIEYDDNRNCERITALIHERYHAWLNRRP